MRRSQTVHHDLCQSPRGVVATANAPTTRSASTEIAHPLTIGSPALLDQSTSELPPPTPNPMTEKLRLFNISPSDYTQATANLTPCKQANIATILNYLAYAKTLGLYNPNKKHWLKIVAGIEHCDTLAEGLAALADASPAPLLYETHIDCLLSRPEYAEMISAILIRLVEHEVRLPPSLVHANLYSAGKHITTLCLALQLLRQYKITLNATIMRPLMSNAEQALVQANALVENNQKRLEKGKRSGYATPAPTSTDAVSANIPSRVGSPASNDSCGSNDSNNGDDTDPQFILDAPCPRTATTTTPTTITTDEQPTARLERQEPSKRQRRRATSDAETDNACPTPAPTPVTSAESSPTTQTVTLPRQTSSSKKTRSRLPSVLPAPHPQATATADNHDAEVVAPVPQRLFEPAPSLTCSHQFIPPPPPETHHGDGDAEPDADDADSDTWATAKTLHAPFEQGDAGEAPYDAPGADSAAPVYSSYREDRAYFETQPTVLPPTVDDTDAPDAAAVSAATYTVSDTAQAASAAGAMRAHLNTHTTTENANADVPAVGKQAMPAATQPVENTTNSAHTVDSEHGSASALVQTEQDCDADFAPVLTYLDTYLQSLITRRFNALTTQDATPPEAQTAGAQTQAASTTTRDTLRTTQHWANARSTLFTHAPSCTLRQPIDASVSEMLLGLPTNDG